MKAILGRRLAVIGLTIAFAVGTPALSAQGAVGPEGRASAGAASSAQPPLIGGLCGIWWDLLDRSLPGLSAIGLTSDQRLIKFKVDRPGWACSIGVVDLPGTETVIGIDYRVQDGKLYGVGSNGGIYTLSTGTAATTKVSQLTVGLQGTFFGVDFNPSADRLRIISDIGQNLRHNVNPGGTTIVDATLTYPPSPAAALGLTGAAYTNNDLDAATATTLFDIDTTLDQVAVQSPANTGQLAATGRLGVNTDPRTGFDIHSTIRNSRAVANRGYAVLNTAGTSGVYAIDLLTGNASLTGTFDRTTVVDLAISLNAR